MGSPSDAEKEELRRQEFQRTLWQQQFWQIGLEHYVNGRRSYYDALIFTGGISFHHAIEYLLKGQLVETEPMDRLKKYGHSLAKSWEAVKRLIPADLSAFDPLIAMLDKFEDIRYPGNPRVTGPMMLSIDFGPPPRFVECKAEGAVPRAEQYHADLNQIDALVAKLMQVFSMRPGAYLPKSQPGKENAMRDNASADPSWLE